MDPISGDLYELLMRQGLRAKPVGAGEAQKNGVADAGGGRTGPALSKGGNPSADLKTSLSQWRTIRERPSLKIADGGKA